MKTQGKSSSLLERRHWRRKIKASPRDAVARYHYASLLEDARDKRGACIERQKAIQCERFNPDYDYSELPWPGWQAVSIAAGEIVRLTDSHWTIYVDAAELQYNLADNNPEKLIEEEYLVPSQEGAKKAWDGCATEVLSIDSVKELEYRRCYDGTLISYDGEHYILL